MEGGTPLRGDAGQGAFNVGRDIAAVSISTAGYWSFCSLRSRCISVHLEPS